MSNETNPTNNNINKTSKTSRTKNATSFVESGTKKPNATNLKNKNAETNLNAEPNKLSKTKKQNLETQKTNKQNIKPLKTKKTNSSTSNVTSKNKIAKADESASISNQNSNNESKKTKSNKTSNIENFSTEDGSSKVVNLKENKTEVNSQESNITESNSKTTTNAESKKNSVVKKIFSVIGIVLFALLLVSVIWVFVDKYIRKSPVTSLFGYSFLTVATGSMEPTINKGCFIVVKSSSNYEVGDVVTFIKNGEQIPTTHRIVSIVGNKIYTRGDANNTNDTGYIEKANIIGKVVKTMPNFGHFVAWVKTGGGWIYFVCGLAIILGGTYVYHSIDSKQENS